MSKSNDLSIEVVFQRYYSRLCHFAWQMVHDHDLVEDIVQDAFMAFWDHKHEILQNEVAIKNFLYSSVRNLCFNTMRHDKVVGKYLAAQPVEPVEDAQVLAKIIRSEVMDEINKIVSAMPKGCQQVFRLGYLEGLTNAQIAEELAISVNTVKTQKQRGLRLVKDRLDPEFLGLVLFLFMEK